MACLTAKNTSCKIKSLRDSAEALQYLDEV